MMIHSSFMWAQLLIQDPIMPWEELNWFLAHVKSLKIRIIWRIQN